MTVGQMRKLMKGLPVDMLVMMPLNDECGATVCKAQSGVVDVQLDDGIKPVLLLQPCTCNTLIEEDQSSIAETYISNPDNVN